MSTSKLVSYIKAHRCFNHPIFKDWALVNPDKKVVGALFHQIRSFCDATRLVHDLPQSLIEQGFSEESGLVQTIAESEENHGPDLAMMAGYIINKMSVEPEFSDLNDQLTIETRLKQFSDDILGSLPGYNYETGLLIQTEKARDVFEGRKAKANEKQNLYKNLGITIALEMVSNGQLIPGEKHCLVDSKLYDVSIDDNEMHYLKEHWGEAGAEAMHEESALQAVSTVINTDNESFIFEGAKEFLDSLLLLWDTLSATMLGSGYLRKAA